MTGRDFRLLRCCATSRPAVGALKEAIEAGVDWQTVLQLAEQHGVRPLLHQSLRSLHWEGVPQRIKADLERFSKANLQRNLSFTGELSRLVRAFQSNGIRVATFKGAVLAELVYGDMSLREFGDLDLIVPDQDVDRAEEVLMTLGYQAFFPDKDYRSAFLSYQGQYAFRHTLTGLPVDLHWRLAGKGDTFALDAAEIWPNLANVAVAGRTVPTFSREDLALFLAAHGTKEGWKRLAWVCDFAEFLRANQNVDWTAVLERAQRAHSSRALLLAILLARNLLDAPAPDLLIEKARSDARIASLAREAEIGMLQSTPSGELADFLGTLKTHDRWRHRFWPIVTLLTTRTVADHRAMPLPKSLWGAYYVTRPFRLTGKAARLVLRGI